MSIDVEEIKNYITQKRGKVKVKVQKSTLIEEIASKMEEIQKEVDKLPKSKFYLEHQTKNAQTEEKKNENDTPTTAAILSGGIPLL